MSFPIRDNIARLTSLREHQILDTPPDGAFDRYTTFAAKHFRVPIALISLVDEDRIWFKSRYGLSVSEIPRTPGLCASVILDDAAYVVRNARTDARTLANPLVAGEMGLQFYAAAPLVTHDGHRLGTFCIIDFEPREFDTEGEETLRSLAGMVMDQMELRLNSRKAVASLSQLVASAIHTVESKYYVTVCAWSKQIKVGHEWMTFEQFLTSTLGVSVTHAIHPDVAHELQKQTQMP